MTYQAISGTLQCRTSIQHKQKHRMTLMATLPTTSKTNHTWFLLVKMEILRTTHLRLRFETATLTSCIIPGNRGDSVRTCYAYTASVPGVRPEGQSRRQTINVNVNVSSGAGNTYGRKKVIEEGPLHLWVTFPSSPIRWQDTSRQASSWTLHDSQWWRYDLRCIRNDGYRKDSNNFDW